MAGTKINHATTSPRCQEGLIDPKRTIQIGLRVRASRPTTSHGERRRASLRTFDKFEERGATGSSRRSISHRQGPVYITIGHRRPRSAWAIGTGVPEIGGLTPRDCQVILRSLRGKNLVGGDICEVAPCYYPSGITSITAANLMWEIALRHRRLPRLAEEVVSVPFFPLPSVGEGGASAARHRVRGCLNTTIVCHCNHPSSGRRLAASAFSHEGEGKGRSTDTLSPRAFSSNAASSTRGDFARATLRASIDLIASTTPG